MNSPASSPSASAPPPNAPAKFQMTGVRKAAIFLTSIGDENCAACLRLMSEDEVHEVTREISLLTSATSEERQYVSERFADALDHGQLLSSGGVEYATSVLIAAFGAETGKRIADRVLKSLGTQTAGIDTLQKADPQHLAKVVQREHPQTIALVLSHLGPSHAAKLLIGLPDTVRAEVVSRMAVLDQISPDVVNKIAKTLSSRLRLLGESSLESFGGVRAVVEVLNRVDAATSDVILNEITQENANLGQAIRNLMFVFDDLLNLDSEGMKKVLSKIDQKVLRVALKGCTPQLQNHFTSFMSARASEMLKEDMAAQGPVRIRDVQEAQQTIIAIAKQLEAEGILSLKPNSGDQYVQ